MVDSFRCIESKVVRTQNECDTGESHDFCEVSSCQPRVVPILHGGTNKRTRLCFGKMAASDPGVYNVTKFDKQASVLVERSLSRPRLKLLSKATKKVSRNFYQPMLPVQHCASGVREGAPSPASAAIGIIENLKMESYDSVLAARSVASQQNTNSAISPNRALRSTTRTSRYLTASSPRLVQEEQLSRDQTSYSPLRAARRNVDVDVKAARETPPKAPSAGDKKGIEKRAWDIGATEGVKTEIDTNPDNSERGTTAEIFDGPIRDDSAYWSPILRRDVAPVAKESVRIVENALTRGDANIAETTFSSGKMYSPSQTLQLRTPIRSNRDTSTGVISGSVKTRIRALEIEQQRAGSQKSRAGSSQTSEYGRLMSDQTARSLEHISTARSTDSVPYVKLSQVVHSVPSKSLPVLPPSSRERKFNVPTGFHSSLNSSVNTVSTEDETHDSEDFEDPKKRTISPAGRESSNYYKQTTEEKKDDSRSPSSAAIIQYWQQRLRQEQSLLASLSEVKRIPQRSARVSSALKFFQGKSVESSRALSQEASGELNNGNSLDERPSRVVAVEMESQSPSSRLGNDKKDVSQKETSLVVVRSVTTREDAGKLIEVVWPDDEVYPKESSSSIENSVELLDFKAKFATKHFETILKNPTQALPDIDKPHLKSPLRARILVSPPKIERFAFVEPGIWLPRSPRDSMISMSQLANHRSSRLLTSDQEFDEFVESTRTEQVLHVWNDPSPGSNWEVGDLCNNRRDSEVFPPSTTWRIPAFEKASFTEKWWYNGDVFNTRPSSSTSPKETFPIADPFEKAVDSYADQFMQGLDIEENSGPGRPRTVRDRNSHKLILDNEVTTEVIRRNKKASTNVTTDASVTASLRRLRDKEGTSSADVHTRVSSSSRTRRAKNLHPRNQGSPNQKRTLNEHIAFSPSRTQKSKARPTQMIPADEDEDTAEPWSSVAFSALSGKSGLASTFLHLLDPFSSKNEADESIISEASESAISSVASQFYPRKPNHRQASRKHNFESEEESKSTAQKQSTFLSTLRKGWQNLGVSLGTCAGTSWQGIPASPSPRAQRIEDLMSQLLGSQQDRKTKRSDRAAWADKDASPSYTPADETVNTDEPESKGGDQAETATTNKAQRGSTDRGVKSASCDTTRAESKSGTMDDLSRALKVLQASKALRNKSDVLMKTFREHFPSIYEDLKAQLVVDKPGRKKGNPNNSHPEGPDFIASDLTPQLYEARFRGDESRESASDNAVSDYGNAGDDVGPRNAYLNSLRDYERALNRPRAEDVIAVFSNQIPRSTDARDGTGAVRITTASPATATVNESEFDQDPPLTTCGLDGDHDESSSISSNSVSSFCPTQHSEDVWLWMDGGKSTTGAASAGVVARNPEGCPVGKASASVADLGMHIAPGITIDIPPTSFDEFYKAPVRGGQFQSQEAIIASSVSNSTVPSEVSGFPPVIRQSETLAGAAESHLRGKTLPVADTSDFEHTGGRGDNWFPFPESPFQPTATRIHKKCEATWSAKPGSDEGSDTGLVRTAWDISVADAAWVQRGSDPSPSPFNRYKPKNEAPAAANNKKRDPLSLIYAPSNEAFEEFDKKAPTGLLRRALDFFRVSRVQI
jgi:hypothetical protein